MNNVYVASVASQQVLQNCRNRVPTQERMHTQPAASEDFRIAKRVSRDAVHQEALNRISGRVSCRS